MFGKRDTRRKRAYPTQKEGSFWVRSDPPLFQKLNRGTAEEEDDDKRATEELSASNDDSDDEPGESRGGAHRQGDL